MTSADDFHLISWRNFFGLAAVALGVMIPVGLRYWFGREVDTSAEAEAGGSMLPVTADFSEDGDPILAIGPPAVGASKKLVENRLAGSADEEEFYSSDEDEDEDLILEAGPAIPGKGKQPAYEEAPLIDLATSSSSSISSLERRP